MRLKIYNNTSADTQELKDIIIQRTKGEMLPSQIRVWCKEKRGITFINPHHRCNVLVSRPTLDPFFVSKEGDTPYIALNKCLRTIHEKCEMI